MNRKEKMLDAKALYLARREALGLPVSNTPTRIKDRTFYLNVKVEGLSGGGEIKLNDSDTKKVVGITNFDGSNLVKGRVLIIDSIRTRFSDNGTVVQNADFQLSAFYKELQNAELRLVQGKEVLIDMPITDTQAFKSDDFREISSLPTIVDEQEFNWLLELPKGVTVPASVRGGANSVFLSIQVRCTEFKQD